MRGSILSLSLPAAWSCVAGILAAPALASGGSVVLPVTFAGLPVGAMEYTVRVKGSDYTIDGQGETGGLGRLASSASSTFRSRGRLGPDAPLPRSHSLAYRDGDKEGSASIRFRAGSIASVKETPPPTPRKDRVPVTKAMLKGAIDPTSAMILPLPADAALAEVCGRTLKISDARNVFTLTFTPDRSVRLKDGTRAHRCAVRYKALGGHRTSSRGVSRFERNRSLRIIYAPLATGSGNRPVWALVGFRMKTRFGIVRGTASGVDGA